MKHFYKTFIEYLCIFIFLTSSTLCFGQKDILLYSTDFTDWAALNQGGASASTVFPASGAGEGFSAFNKPIIDPTATIGGYTGYFTSNSNGGTINFKPFDFVEGGVVETLIYINGDGNRVISVTGGTVSQVMFEELTLTGASDYRNILAGTTNMAQNDGVASADRAILGTSKLNTWHLGSTVQIRYTGFAKVAFYLPSLAGITSLSIAGTTTKIYIVGLNIYSGVGSTVPYVGSVNYPKDPAGGLKMLGSVGGATNSGTLINQAIKAELWNSNNDVTATIVGTDSMKFGFGDVNTKTLTISNASIKNIQKQIDIAFSPSVRAGLSKAKLKLNVAGSLNPYYVSLDGITGSINPLIVTDTATIPFWTSLIENTSQSIYLSGLNLTGDISLKVTGAGAARFSLDTYSITKLNAGAGTSVKINFLGDIVASTLAADLEISSPSATTLKIPLKAITMEKRPTLHNLVYEVVPAGSGYVINSPAGKKFLDKSTVVFNVIPEAGWKVDYWSDMPSINRMNRTVTVSNLNNTDNGVSYKIHMIQGTPPPVATESINAHVPTYTTGNDNVLNITWSAISGAISYTIKKYDANGTLIDSNTSSTTNYTLTSLLANTKYMYSVETTVGTTTYDSGKMGPYKTSGPATTPQGCGQ